jgi:hypothetical protein
MIRGHFVSFTGFRQGKQCHAQTFFYFIIKSSQGGQGGKKCHAQTREKTRHHGYLVRAMTLRVIP